MKTLKAHREEIVRYGRMLHANGFVAATDGNLSVRVDADTILMTPTGMSKGLLEPDDLVVVDRNGRKISGQREVSSEIAMHLLVYRLRPEVHGVVHAHPPTATGFAAAGIALDQALISELVLALDSVPLARYGTPGTTELCDALEPLVIDHNAVLMANHGVVTCGEDLTRAFMNMETVEHFAKVSLVARLLGRQEVLSEQDVDKLREARQRYMAAQLINNAGD